MHSITASTDESSLCPPSDNTGAMVGGVVALVAMVVIAVTVVMVTYLVLRYKRGEQNVSLPRFKVVCVESVSLV